MRGGYIPVDLNNLFVSEAESYEVVLEAERAGFPQNSCAWVKGLYATAYRHGFKKVAVVREGDCSQNIALEDVWRHEGMQTQTFSYPYQRTREAFARELKAFAAHFQAAESEIDAWKERLDAVRSIARSIDRIAVETLAVSSLELFLSQLNLTDFMGDVARVEAYQLELLQQVECRKAVSGLPRLGVLGVPTILSDLSEVIDELGARVVYHEIPYEFAMLKSIGRSMADTYLNYTYPYSAEFRLEAIAEEVVGRRLDGIIHYTQSFCHRQIHDLLMRRRFNIPILTIEGDRPTAVDGRTLTRIEAFIEQLR